MSKRPWLIATLLALAALTVVAVLVSAATWTAWFTHPLRLERLGRVPESTIQAGWFVRLAWPTLAVATTAALLVLIRIAPTRDHVDRPQSAPSPCGLRRPLGTTIWIVAALMTIAAVVRAPRLIESFWFDELATLLDYAQFGPGVIVSNAFTQANHTLHTLATWLAMSTFGGVDELILRVPTLLASLATVPAIWWLSREALPDRPVVAPIAGVLVATMPVIVLSGVEARGYSMMILFAALATAAFLRAQRIGRPVDFVVYAALAALGVWAHLVTVCVPLAHGAIVIATLRDPDRRRVASAGAVALVVAALLTLIALAPSIPDLLAIRRDFLALDGNEPTLWGAEGLHALLQLGGSWAWWATLPGMALAIVGAVALAQSRTGRVVLLTGVLGALIAATLTTLGNSWLYARFLLFTAPTVAVAIAAALEIVARRRGAPLATSVGLVVVALWLGDVAIRPPKQPLRDAVELVAHRRQPHERVATIGLPDNLIAYYGQSHDLEIHPTGPLGVDLEPALAAIRPHWVIVLYPDSVRSDRFDLLRAADFVEHAELPGWADWGNGRLVIWRREG